MMDRCFSRLDYRAGKNFLATCFRNEGFTATKLWKGCKVGLSSYCDEIFKRLLKRSSALSPLLSSCWGHISTWLDARDFCVCGFVSVGGYEFSVVFSWGFFMAKVV